MPVVINETIAQVVIDLLTSQVENVVAARDYFERSAQSAADEVVGLRNDVRELNLENARLADLANDRYRTIVRLENEIRALEADLRRERGYVTVAQFDWESVDGLDFIPAIKEFRERTGLGLKESKEAVERAYTQGLIRFAGGYIPVACK